MQNTASYLLFLGIMMTSDAIASPPITSTGSNPVWATGGNQSTGTRTLSLIAASSTQDLLVTDVVFSITGSASSSYSCTALITLQDGSGNVLSSYRVASRDNVNYGGGVTPSNISHQYRAGLPVSAGDTLELVTDVSCGGFSYSVAGLYVQP